MTNYTYFILFLIFSLLPGSASAITENDIVPQLQRLSAARTIGAETLRSGRALHRFYQERQFRPAWSVDGQLLPLAEELIATLPIATGGGLDPSDYHFSALNALTPRYRATPTPLLLAQLDILLSDAFMHLATDTLSGRILPSRVDPDWDIPREEGDPVRMLNQSLASGRIHDSLLALLPQDPAYLALSKAWQDLTQLAAVGGWPHLSLKRTLRSADVGVEVAELRRRLVTSGDLPGTESEGEIFDTTLDSAVRRFQSRHGLTADGVVGPQTLTALNVTAEERAHQLAVNLERWRWLPRRFGERYLRVNLPAFHLEYIESGEVVLDMKVIVGRQVRQTPAFVGKMTYLVLNPYWEVPDHLAVVDLLPKIQKDFGYLHEHGVKVFTPNGATRLDPATLNWQSLSRNKFPYHLRQDPGPKNSLGRIKFIFPNTYNIYLHDTPSRKLFDKDQRSFSSGCIRIEKPFELAQKLLQGRPLASSVALEGALKTAVNQIVPLTTPLPVYLLYLTAWVDKDGTLNFRPDLYNRDRRLDVALRQIGL